MNCFPFELGKKVTVNHANPSLPECPPKPQLPEHKLNTDTTGQQILANVAFITQILPKKTLLGSKTELGDTVARSTSPFRPVR